MSTTSPGKRKKKEEPVARNGHPSEPVISGGEKAATPGPAKKSRIEPTAAKAKPDQAGFLRISTSSTMTPSGSRQ